VRAACLDIQVVLDGARVLEGDGHGLACRHVGRVRLKLEFAGRDVHRRWPGGSLLLLGNAGEAGDGDGADADQSQEDVAQPEAQHRWHGFVGHGGGDADMFMATCEPFQRPKRAPGAGSRQPRKTRI
jgi:hypothetical protein